MSRPQSQQDTYNDSTHFFLLSPAEVARRLESDIEHGLSTSTAAARHSHHGPNQLAGGGGVSPWGILAAQIFNAMILVLIICLAVSLGIQSWIESGVIAGVIIINVSVGFAQEYASAKTMDSLRSLASPTAQVIRDSKSVTVPSGQVTIGDLVELKTGDVVPADLRLVEAMNFETDEALLTGESLPVAKDVNATWDAKGEDGLKLDPRDIGVGDRITIAYTSSTVTKGRAKGVVISIGMNTEIGAIAKSLRGGDTRVRKVRRNEDGHAPWHRYFSSWGLTVADTIGSFLGTNVGTPLHRTLSWLAITLFCVAGVFAGFCFAANNGNTDREIILYAIATGLSMIPASLVVVLTITLSGGTKAMVRRSVIVRKMDALEALGAVTDICSDKTGTLTQGKMVCKAAWIPSRGTVLVGESSEAFNPRSGDLSFVPHSPAESAILEVAGNISSAPSVTAAELVKTHQAPLEAVLNIVSMCGVAKVFESGDGWIARGDPSECALQIFAHRFGWGRERWTAGEEPQWTQLWEYPFDSDLKRMSVVYTRHSDEKQFVFMKGAVERVIDACADVQTAEGRVPLDADMKATILANVEALAEQGLRVLGLAQKSWQPTNGEPERADVENAMTLQGLVGLYDPPRPETQGAVRAAHHAGIQVHMLTGDHVATARAIALQVGILPRNIGTLSKESTDAMVMTAAQFDKLSEDEIDALPILPLVVARCAPNTKVRMVDALHRRKAFAAMTGDGVNDSPSLKRADVGIAMGLSGSDVAKDASDIVLTDDNFASILNAVEEGRRIFDNICKFVLHLLAGNVMQALVLLVGLSFKDNTNLSVFPLTPIEILWIIMITSSFPAMGLGAQCASPDVMRRKPHDLKVGVFSKEVLADMMWYGVSGAGCCLSVFTLIVWGWGNGNLGIDSNNSIGDGSDLVFRARSATFATMTWICLLLAFEVMDMRRCFFRMKPKTEYPFTQWARDVWVNRFLLWSVIGGFISVFPLIYIPKLNTVVFKHAPITWEIALSFVSVLVFIVLAELWKLSKRVYLRHMYKWSDEDDEEMGGVFAAWKTMDVSYTQAEGEGRVAV